MPNKRISELNLHTSLLNTDVLPIVNSNQTKRVLYGSIKENIHSTYNTGSLIQSSSISGSNLIFEKGDSSTYNLDLSQIIPPGLGGQGLGWARYDDGQYTKTSPLTLTSGVSTDLPNDGSTTVETFMNSTKKFYNPTTGRVQMANNGDVYSMVVTFSARPVNANQTHLDLSLSATGTTPYDRVSKSLTFAKGNSVWQNFYEVFNFYGDADFVTNGNKWTITADGGNVSIANVIYFIQRTYTSQ